MMGLFKKREKEEIKPLKSEVIVFEMLSSDEDHYITNLAAEIIKGNPLIVNFGEIDIDGANKAVAFLSGVVFAINGEIYRIEDKIFLFASSDIYEDGSMKPFLKTLE